jgi:nucleoid-associated protein EbfC
MKGMQNIMKQANQMQLKMKKLQEELATREYEGTAGGDGVKIKVKGESEIVSVQMR